MPARRSSAAPPSARWSLRPKTRPRSRYVAPGYWRRSTRPCSRMAELGPLTCAGCGLLCDDVLVERAGDGVRLEHDCHLGVWWFSESVLQPPGAPAAKLDGQPVDVAEAL